MSAAIEGQTKPRRTRPNANSRTNTRRAHSGQNQGGHASSSHHAQPLHQHVQPQLLNAAQQKRLPSQNDIALLYKSGALIAGARVSEHMRQYTFDAELARRLAHKAQIGADARGRQRNANVAVDTVDSCFDLRHTWNQINLAAVALASIVDRGAQLLFVASNERAGVGATRAANLLGAQAIIGRYVPGSLSNPGQETYIEPTWIVCASATEDVQAIKESAVSNSAVIAFCDSSANLNNIDIPIGCNTSSRLAIGVMYYFLVRQTLHHLGQLFYGEQIEGHIVDHFIQQKKSQKKDDEDEQDDNEEAKDANQDGVKDGAVGVDEISGQHVALDNQSNEDAAANWMPDNDRLIK